MAHYKVYKSEGGQMISAINSQVLSKHAWIADLENKVENLENKLDGYEQYYRRSNLRFLGIEEIVSDEQLEFYCNIFQNKLAKGGNGKELHRHISIKLEMPGLYLDMTLFSLSPLPFYIIFLLVELSPINY